MTPRLSGSLVFSSASDPISCEAGEVCIELLGDNVPGITRELLESTAAAVLHYFRTEKGLQTVPLSQFADAMVLVLKGFGLKVQIDEEAPDPPRVAEADLDSMAKDCGDTFELAFFPKLRQELAGHLQSAPPLIRFRGLRSCVMQLAGARRWSPRCQALNDQIVEYLRDCLSRESEVSGCALVIE